jgi:heme A synthase
MTLHRFAIITAVATFVLLLVGGTVNPTGSSLACPDWPTCYGSFFPAMKNGVEFEHTHRLVATAVGLMTLVLAFAIWRGRPEDRRLQLLGWTALGLVVVQGVLGGVTVLLKLPMLVSVGHLGLSMGFFVLLIYLAYRLRPGAEPLTVSHGVPRGLIWLGTAAVFIQVLLGAFVRHSHSGRACNDDWLLCSGQLWPAWHPAQLHMIHRLVGLVVLAVVLAASVAAARRAVAAGRPLARATALAAPFLALLQIVLGALLVRSSIGLWQAVAHTGVAALLLAAMAVSAFALGPVRERAVEPRLEAARARPAEA